MSRKTKAKATKKPKIGKQAKNQRDVITGLSLTSDAFGEVVSDQYYDQNSEVIKRARVPGLIGTEFELSKQLMIVTSMFSNNDGSKELRRIAYNGEFSFQGREVVRASINSIGLYQYEESGGKIYESVEITNFSPSRIVEDIRVPKAFDKAVSNDGVPRSLSVSIFDGRVVSKAGSFDEIFSFGSGNVFQSGWWNNPFSPNLI
jgi:hypothetical protein